MSDLDKCTGQFAPHGICEPVEGYGQCPELLPRAVRELSDLCAAKDAEIAKLREALKGIIEWYEDEAALWGDHDEYDRILSDARRALEASDDS